MAKACVMVYGDVGRSPRMQNHAMELSNSHEVYLMGPRSEIKNNRHIHLVDLQLINYRWIRAISYYLYVLIRILLQVLHGLYLLAYKHRDTSVVLIQNPPCVPVLFTVWLASLVTPFKVIVDFHNYGYTILALGNRNKAILKAAEKYEKWFGSKVHAALCVSDTMKEHLSSQWGIQAITIYDRPLSNRQIPYDKTALFKKYSIREASEGELFLVSSTSWTKDEDFSVLFQALEAYEASDSPMLIRTLITGKGPEKEMYLKQIAEKQCFWKKITITTLWLEADDYPLLLKSCDVGVCLHFSSSGFDLPMKVVDMFAAGLPVLAKSYPTLRELVKQESNGYVFENKTDLCGLLCLITSHPDTLLRLKKEVQKEGRRTWHEEWNKCAKLFRQK